MKTTKRSRNSGNKRDLRTRPTWLSHLVLWRKLPSASLAACNLQHKLQVIQNKWWSNHAEKTLLCANSGDYRGFYEALKAIYGPAYHNQSPLRSATDKESILSRWSQHFFRRSSALYCMHVPSLSNPSHSITTSENKTG